MIPVNDIQGLKVLITGASSGIGAAAARAFSRSGAEVTIHYNRRREEAESLAAALREEGGTAHVVSGDVTRAEDAEDIVARSVAMMGGLDCLVNNAGAILRSPSADFDEAIYDRVFDLNTRSILRMVRHAGPALKASDRASVINLGSIAGRNGGAPGSGLYAAAKAAVHSLTRALAREMAADGVRVNAISPGVIETPFHDETPESALNAALAAIPLGRLGTAEDCAWSFVFLASPTMAGYITGQILDINGGQLMP
ncbi:SDR family NAD(P)-dependent oxidoreductase [Martelella sp. AD-3]|uniref:SDR family NAD(P)-dependent oxidoreductase n=1 Tax=Martelella sp. AD-3 TaxID=686597 RepID=UPI000465FC10|nr:SDR family NAD(P)-dependent oxidoreductase [Martelella sp. AD-3]AMM85778.1 oxidoreductase [Martelella sp. AD-3]